MIRRVGKYLLWATGLAAFAALGVMALMPPDEAFSFTLMTVSKIPEQRYERLLLRDHQPRSQSWDGRWIYELEPSGGGTRLRITEYGSTDGFPFFIMQRIVADPDAFLKFYANRIGQVLNDPPAVQVLRSH